MTGLNTVMLLILTCHKTSFINETTEQHNSQLNTGVVVHITLPWWNRGADNIKTVATPTTRSKWVEILWITLTTVWSLNLCCTLDIKYCHFLINSTMKLHLHWLSGQWQQVGSDILLDRQQTKWRRSKQLPPE